MAAMAMLRDVRRRGRCAQLKRRLTKLCLRFRTAKDDRSILQHLKIFRWGGYPLVMGPDSFSRVSKFFLAWAVLWVFVNVAIQYVLRFVNVDRVGPFYKIMGQIEAVFACLNLPLQTIWILAYRFYFSKSIKELISLQDNFGLRNYTMFGAVKLCWSLALFVLTAFCGVVHLIPDLRVRRKTRAPIPPFVQWFLLLCLFTNLIVQTLTLTFFTYLVCCLGTIFATLSRTVFVGEADVRRFVRMYHRIADLSSDITRYFDPVVSTTLVVSFLHSISETSFFMKNSDVELKYYVTVLLTVSLFVLAVAHLIYVCQWAAEQADSCCALLNEHLMHGPDGPNYNDVYVVLHVCAKRSVTFKILRNSIAIDYNLAFDMVAAYVTYTIISYQIDITGQT